MSIKVMSEIWEHAPCADNELLMLLAIADMANDERDCWPSEKRLQWKVRCSYREMEKILESLQLQGILTIEARERKDGGKASNLYHITETSEWALLTMDTPPSTSSSLNAVDTPNTPLAEHANDTPSTSSSLNAVDESSGSTHQKKHTPRKRDDIFDAIAEVWHINAGGYIGQMKSMMCGTAKHGELKRCNFEPPVTSGDEIRAFGVYAKQRMAEKNIQDMPTVAVTIQRWFYDFRLTQQKQAGDAHGKTKADEQMEINRLAMREANGTL